MKVLVTGGGGFLGLNIVKRLLYEGDEVVCLDQNELGAEALEFLNDHSSAFFFEKGDVRDFEKIRSVLNRYDIRRVIHAAAVTPSLKEEQANPERIMEINFSGTVNVIHAARESAVDRIVFVSSNSIYGDVEADDVRVTEEHPLNARNLYSIAKIASEMYCGRIQELSGLQILIGRVSSAYGPMEHPTSARNHLSLVYQIVQQAIAGNEMRIFGESASRNWTHVYDLVAALTTLLKKEDLSYSVYNLSYGCSYSLKELLETVKKVEPKFRYSFTDTQKDANLILSTGEHRGILDNSRLIHDAGFVPAYNLQKGLEQYLSWLGQAKLTNDFR